MRVLCTYMCDYSFILCLFFEFSTVIVMSKASDGCLISNSPIHAHKTSKGMSLSKCRIVKATILLHPPFSVPWKMVHFKHIWKTTVQFASQHNAVRLRMHAGIYTKCVTSRFIFWFKYSKEFTSFTHEISFVQRQISLYRSKMKISSFYFSKWMDALFGPKLSCTRKMNATFVRCLRTDFCSISFSSFVSCGIKTPPPPSTTMLFLANLHFVKTDNNCVHRRMDGCSNWWMRT